MSINVYIIGDKDGFNSKIAIDKFKAMVKSSNKDDINIETLKSKYIKPEYNLSIESKSETEIKFQLNRNTKNTTENDVDKKQALRMKLNMMKKNRTNVEVTAAKGNKNVPDDILEEYIKLKKVAGTMPIPEPGEILAKPDEYKPLIAMVLGNDIIKQKGANHPYTRYFRLLAEKLGVTTPEPTPLQDYTELLKNKVTNEITNIKGNNLVTADYETDSETTSSDSEN